MRQYKPSSLTNKVKSSRHKRAGKKAQSSGKQAEQFMLSTDINGLVYKRYEPYKRLTGGTIFKAQSMEKSGCDYSVFTSTCSGMIEVKSRDSDRISLSALDETQHGQLQALSEMGLIALVLVRLTSGWYVIPYPLFKTPPNGKKSWNSADLTALSCQVSVVDGVMLLQSHINKHYTPTT